MLEGDAATGHMVRASMQGGKNQSQKTFRPLGLGQSPRAAERVRGQPKPEVNELRGKRLAGLPEAGSAPARAGRERPPKVRASLGRPPRQETLAPPTEPERCLSHSLSSARPRRPRILTEFAFSLPQAGHVTLRIVDVAGHVVATPVDREMSA